MIAVAKPHPNEIARELTGRPYLSYSAISTFQQCPLRYFFRYVAGLPEDTVSASLVLGGSIHAALEHHYREVLAGLPAPRLDELFGAYRAAWRAYDGQDVIYNKGEEAGTLDELAGRILSAFQESELSQPQGTILGIEEELTGELVPSCPDLLARLDLLVDSGDELVVTDFKTARSRWSSSQASDAAGQLLLYHELVKPLADGRPIRLEFAVVTKTKTPEVCRHPVELDPRRMERTRRIFERVWQAIQAGNFYPNPSPMQCPTCAFRAPCRAWSG